MLRSCIARVELVSVPAHRLGLVHRGVRALQYVVDVDAVVRVDADPDAGRRCHGLPGDIERLAQRREDLAGHHGGVFGGIQLRQQNREFVAAEPGDGVVFAQAAVQAAGDRLQQLVGAHVAEGVIDRLEAIQVEQ